MDKSLTNLIDLTLKQISKGYIPGTLKWVKRTRPAQWGSLLTGEREINLAAGSGNPRTLKRVLDSYQKLLGTLCREFKERRDER